MKLATVEERIVCSSKAKFFHDRWNVYEWEDSERTPAAMLDYITRSPDPSIHFPWPVKFIRHWDWFIGRGVIVVRTDAYPLWWMIVWLRNRAEGVAHHDFGLMMYWANKLGLAKTPECQFYSLKDFLWWR